MHEEKKIYNGVQELAYNQVLIGWWPSRLSSVCLYSSLA